MILQNCLSVYKHAFICISDRLPAPTSPLYHTCLYNCQFYHEFPGSTHSYLGFLTYLSRKEGAQQDESHSGCPIKSKQTKTLFIANLINNKPNTLSHTHTHTRGVKNLRTFKCFCCGCANLRAKRGERPEEDQPQQKRPPALGAPKGCGDI